MAAFVTTMFFSLEVTSTPVSQELSTTTSAPVMTSHDVTSEVSQQLQVVKSTAHADPGFQQSKVEVLKDAKEISIRLWNKTMSVPVTVGLPDTTGADIVYQMHLTICRRHNLKKPRGTVQKLKKINTFGDPNYNLSPEHNNSISGLLLNGTEDAGFLDMEDEARLSPMYSSMYVARRWLYEMEWDEEQAQGSHSEFAANLTACRHQLETFITSLDVTIHVLGVQHPGTPSYVMEPEMRDPPSEFRRHFRDFLVLRDFETAVMNSYHHLYVMHDKYTS
ncbi:hypothetical protein Bbelb_132610 [Branchiostoma belcheri]|nr:hypothetical protein Bbelb_132610 [Branchiostoma belcheri]